MTTATATVTNGADRTAQPATLEEAIRSVDPIGGRIRLALDALEKQEQQLLKARKIIRKALRRNRSVQEYLNTIGLLTR